MLINKADSVAKAWHTLKVLGHVDEVLAAAKELECAMSSAAALGARPRTHAAYGSKTLSITWITPLLA